MIASTDPVSDMLARIRNAILVNKNSVVMPYSKIKHATATTIKESGYLKDVSQSGEGINKQLEIIINDVGSNPTITHIKRVSKPGRRIYAKAKHIPTVKNGRGITVISTSRGIMTGDQARKQSLGGEVICEVY